MSDHQDAIRAKVAEGMAYRQEAAMLLGNALHERAPATAEAIQEAGVEPRKMEEALNEHEFDAVRALARLLEAIDSAI